MCWLYQGWEFMHWSDLTELQEREHSIQRRESYDVNDALLKGTSWQGISEVCAQIHFKNNLLISTGYCMLLEGQTSR